MTQTPDYDARCTGTDCPGCEAGRRHYRDTGCTVAGCPGGHARVIPPVVGES
jgi:hypothetical protein